MGDAEAKQTWQTRLKRFGVSIVPNGAVAIYLADGKGQWLNLLAQQRTINPNLVSLVVGGPSILSSAIAALNQGGIDFFLDQSADDEALCSRLKCAAELSLQRSGLRAELDRARDQNRQLEALGQGLEDRVKERTQSELNSKVELEQRVTQLRDLLRFMQDLTTANSPEEMLGLLRREVKIYHRLGEPVLAYSSGPGERHLVYSRAGSVLERLASTAWPQSLRLRKNEAEDSQYLANQFGRPVGRVVAIPLVARKSEEGGLQPTLFFEHQLKEGEIDHFLRFVSERLQVLSVALDRLLLEMDLRRATYLWEHTFDGLEDPVAIIDLEYSLMRSNKAFLRGDRADQCHVAFNQTSGPCSGCPLRSAMDSGQPTRSLVKRGEQVYAVHSYPIRLEQGEYATTAVNHYVNVTEALSLQEKIVQTEKMAALGHLAGHIAHELNNPLTGIRGLAQVWRAQSSLSETIRSDLKEIESAAERSQTIITNLLNFSRAGQNEVQQDVDFNEVVRRTLPLLKTALHQHGLNVEYVEEPAWVKADAQLLSQIIFNLVKNACQAMNEKGQIGVRLFSLEKDGVDSWALEVSDTGVGMNEEQMESLFTPFFTTKGKGEGTGLGLSLSQSLVQKFGGEIAAVSTVGAGSTFTVILPKGQK